MIYEVHGTFTVDVFLDQVFMHMPAAGLLQVATGNCIMGYMQHHADDQLLMSLMRQSPCTLNL